MLAAVFLTFGLMISDVAIERTRPLSFGEIVVPESGSVTVPPSGMMASYNRVYPMRGEPQAALFEVTGEPHEPVEITVPIRVAIDSGAVRGVFRDIRVEARHARDFTKVAEGVYHIRLDGGGRNTLALGGLLELVRRGDGADFTADVWVSARSLKETLADE